MWELTLVCDCSGVSTGFQRIFECWFSIFKHLSCPPFFQPVFLWPNRYSTDYICSFNLSFQLAQWFSTGSLAVSTDSTGFKQVALAVFQQVFYWSSNRFSTSCDWLAVEFSRDDGNRCHKDEEDSNQRGNRQVDSNRRSNRLGDSNRRCNRQGE